MFLMVMVMVFNTTFNNISVISWLYVFEERMRSVCNIHRNHDQSEPRNYIQNENQGKIQDLSLCVKLWNDELQKQLLSCGKSEKNINRVNGLQIKWSVHDIWQLIYSCLRRNIHVHDRAGTENVLIKTGGKLG